MSKNQELTVMELKLLFTTRFKILHLNGEKLKTRFQQALGKETQEEKPESVAIRNRFMDNISGTIARRLKRNQRTTPLLSSRDIVRFIPSVISDIEKMEGSKLDTESRKIVEKAIKSMYEVFFEMVLSMVPPRKNLYAENWRWVMTVLDLAAERNIQPIELLALEEATDEITRRMFSKRQFVAQSKKEMNKILDPEMIKKNIFEQYVDRFAEDNEELRRYLEQEIETKYMPQLREEMVKTRVIASEYLSETVQRIYAAQ